MLRSIAPTVEQIQVVVNIWFVRCSRSNPAEGRKFLRHLVKQVAPPQLARGG
jgi:hypothetical protein